MDAGVLGEVVGAVGDLRSRRRHEMVEDPRGHVPLLRLQRLDGLFEVGANDLFGTAELVRA